MDGLIHLAEHDRQDASHRMNRCHRKGISRVLECQVRRSRSRRRGWWDSVRMAHSGALFRRVICSLVPQHPRAQTPSIERFLSGNRTIYYVHIFFRYIRNDTSYCEVEWIFRFLFSISSDEGVFELGGIEVTLGVNCEGNPMRGQLQSNLYLIAIKIW